MNLRQFHRNVAAHKKSTEGTDSSLNEAPQEQWKVRHVYGQFKTAMSVTRKLRSQGIVARARQRADGNCVVEVHDGQPGLMMPRRER